MPSDTNTPKAKNLIKYVQATGKVCQEKRKPETELFLSII